MITEFRRHGGVERFGIPRARGGLSILEFPKARGGLDEDAARGRVWIFSGITHCFFPPKNNKLSNQTVSIKTES